MRPAQMEKSPEAFRTISEVADWLDTPAHVLRFWESRFPEIAPVKRAGGRRYYRPEDMQLLGGIKHLLHTEGHTIKSVQERLKAGGPSAISAFSPPLSGAPAIEPDDEDRIATLAHGHNGHAGGSADIDMIETAEGPEHPHEDPGPGGWAPSLIDATAYGTRPAPVQDRLPAAEAPDLPPIGFFFDDSDDAAPAADQSGTFAAPLAGEPDLFEPDGPELFEPGGPDLFDMPPDPEPELALQPQLLPPLPDLPADAEDGASLGAAAVSAAAGLRGLTRRDLPADWRHRLPGIVARLERIGRGDR